MVFTNGTAGNNSTSKRTNSFQESNYSPQKYSNHPIIDDRQLNAIKRRKNDEFARLGAVSLVSSPKHGNDHIVETGSEMNKSYEILYCSLDCCSLDSVILNKPYFVPACSFSKKPQVTLCNQEPSNNEDTSPEVEVLRRKIQDVWEDTDTSSVGIFVKRSNSTLDEDDVLIENTGSMDTQTLTHLIAKIENKIRSIDLSCSNNGSNVMPSVGDQENIYQDEDMLDNDDENTRNYTQVDGGICSNGDEDNEEYDNIRILRLQYSVDQIDGHEKANSPSIIPIDIKSSFSSDASDLKKCKSSFRSRSFDMQRKMPKRCVSFSEEVVTAVHKVDRCKLEDKESLFYSSKDMQDFRLRYLWDLKQQRERRRQRRSSFLHVFKDSTSKLFKNTFEICGL